MMLPSFLTRPITRLSPDGSLADSGLRLSALGAPVLLLGRERCRFELFTTPAGLSGSTAAKAARVYADTHAPYSEAGSAIARKGALFGIWWWDAGWVSDQLLRHDLSPTLRVLPEAVAQPEALEWRVIRDSTGYEAQLWDDGFLISSVWRRRPFDTQTWAAFTRVRQRAENTAPQAPPSAHPLPYTARAPYRRRIVASQSFDSLLPLAGGIGASVLICATALLAGQGVGLVRERKLVDAQLVTARARALVNQQPALTRQAQQLGAFRAYVAQPDPLVLVAEAQRILMPFKVKISDFTADSDEVTFTIPAEAVAGIDILTEDLEASPRFIDVRPSLDRQKKQLTIRMAVRNRPHRSSVTS